MTDRSKGIITVVLLLAILVGAISGLVWYFAFQYGAGVSQTTIRYDSVSGKVQSVDQGPFSFKGKAFFDNIVTIPTSVQTISLEGAQNGVFILSKDNLEIELDVTVRYQVAATSDNLISLWRQYPTLNWETTTIQPIIRAVVRDVVAGYNAEELQLVRDKIQAGVESELSTKVGNETSLNHGITVIGTQITDITLPKSFLDAIQAKLNAQQAQLQAQFEANKLIIQANAQKNATIITAQAQAQALLINANATAQAHVTIATGTATAIKQICTTEKLNETQCAQVTNIYTTLQLLSNLTNQNIFLILGNPSNGTSFILPVQPKPQ